MAAPNKLLFGGSSRQFGSVWRGRGLTSQWREGREEEDGEWRGRFRGGVSKISGMCLISYVLSPGRVFGTFPTYRVFWAMAGPLSRQGFGNPGGAGVGCLGRDGAGNDDEGVRVRGRRTRTRRACGSSRPNSKLIINDLLSAAGLGFRKRPEPPPAAAPSPARRARSGAPRVPPGLPPSPGGSRRTPVPGGRSGGRGHSARAPGRAAAAAGEAGARAGGAG